MNIKFIIFVVFATVAQCSADSPYQVKVSTDLTKLINHGNTTLAHFYSMAANIFEAIEDRRVNSGSNQEAIKRRVVTSFNEALNVTVEAVRMIATNATGLEKGIEGIRDLLEHLISTVWTGFDVTPATTNLTATQAEFRALRLKAEFEVHDIWNATYARIRESVASDSTEVNAALARFQRKSTVCFVSAIDYAILGIEVYVTELAGRDVVDKTTALRDIEINYILTRASMTAESNEKYALFQYILTYQNLGTGVEILNTLVRFSFDEITLNEGLWSIFGITLFFLEIGNINFIPFDALQGAIYETFDSTFNSVVYNVRSIPFGNPMQYDEVAVRQAMLATASGIRSALDPNSEWNASGAPIGEIRQQVLDSVLFVWEVVYRALKETSSGFDGGVRAIDSAWDKFQPGVEIANNVLFDVINQNRFVSGSNGNAMLSGLWTEVTRQYDIIRGLYLAAFLKTQQIYVSLPVTYNDQLT